MILNSSEEQTQSQTDDQSSQQLQQTQVDTINRNSFKELQQTLKQMLSKCFLNEDLMQFEIEFKQLKQTIQDILSQKLYQIFDIHFFQKIFLLSYTNNPLKGKKIIEMYIFLLKDKMILDQLCLIAKKERIIIDLLNSFFTLMEKFQNTHLEWNLKILFENINDNLSQYDFYCELLNSVSIYGGRLIYKQTLNTEQEQLVEKIKILSLTNDINKNNEAITLMSIILGKCSTFEEQFFMFTSILTPNFQNLVQTLSGNSDQVKVLFYNALLDILDRYIFQTEYSIIIDKTHLHETRQYTLKNEKQYLMNHPQIYYSVATILNEVLLMPQEIVIQCRAFILIRRMYYLFQDQRKLFEGPISVVLTNIVLFSKEPSQEKDPTIFFYKLLKSDDTSQSFIEKLERNTHLNKLKENKYFSVKALSYSNDHDAVYKFRNFYLSILSPLYKKIDAGAFFHYNILVQKPNTIVYWNFKTIDYDIQFGFYKIDSLDEFLIQDYLQERNVKSIIKLQKSECYKQQVTVLLYYNIIQGFSLLNIPGFYRILFDNTYSFWRAKEIFYQILVLET